MTYTIVGLGNKGEEYALTRHNIGRIMLELFRKKYDFPEWQPESKNEKKNKYLYSKGSIGKHSVTLVLPELYMNKSGASITPLITSKKKAETLVVVYDDIDIGFLDRKIAYGRGSGGHNGIESIIKALKTKDFIRVRIGIAPTTSTGKVKKPKGEEKVLKFLMSNFGKKETDAFPALSRTINEMLETIVTKGKERAMNAHN